MSARANYFKLGLFVIAGTVVLIAGVLVLGATNAGSESINAKIQRVKRRACGYRNRERFRNAILFQLGGLDLYPAAVSATHTDS